MSQSGSGEAASGSVEASIPTDLTVTSEADSEPHASDHHRRYAREIHVVTSEKNQLMHSVEKLRLALQGSEAQLQATKSRYENLLDKKYAELGTKLSEKQATINRVEAELKSTTEELNMLKERAAKELAHLMEKCLHFQQNQERFVVKQDEIKATLNNIMITEGEYQRLKTQSHETLNLKEIAALRLHEIIVPLKLKVKELESLKASLENALKAREKELEETVSCNLQQDQEIGVLQNKLIGTVSQCEELRKELQLDDYRIRNFERVKRERDKYEDENERLTRERGEFELSSAVFKKERDVLEERLAESKNKLRVQGVELAKYQNDYHDTRSHLDKGKEEALKTYSLLKSERERSEDFQEKFLKCRAEVISLSDQCKDYENQVTSLTEKFSSSSKAERKEKEKVTHITMLYEQLLRDMESLQSKYIKEKDLKKEELNELKASYSSLAKNYNKLLEENGHLQKRSEVLRQSDWQKQLTNETQITDLKREVSELKKKLDVYKSLEDDYLSTLRTFAALPAEPITEGAKTTPSGIPTFSIIRGKVSEENISLTRRILHLEKQSVDSCEVIQRLTVSLDQMRTNLASYKAAIALAGKPSNQLLERISSQEEQIISLETALRACNESKADLKTEVDQLLGGLQKVSHYHHGDDDLRHEIESIRSDLRMLQDFFKHYSLPERGTSGKRNALPSAIKITKKKVTV